MDSIEDKEIQIDVNGICNYCRSYIDTYGDYLGPNPPVIKGVDDLIAEIKSRAKGKKYDCIMGLSGGIDSSFLALKAKEWGLRPLMVHFDNGWNSELAVENIHNIVDKLGFDLFTYVVNWNEFMDLQNAYIQSGVIDWEVPTDHGFYAVLHKLAHKHNIPNVLAGFNHQTEGVLDKGTSWKKQDLLNLIDIHKKHGRLKLKTYPRLGFWRLLYYQRLLDLQVFSPLDKINYDKNSAKVEIAEKLGWRDYGGKHYESIFTRFYQGYVLPRKYGKDKRKSHLSSLINSGQISRLDALEELRQPPYPNEELLRHDIDYFKKKMQYSDIEFNSIFTNKPVPHIFYNSYYKRHYKVHSRIFQLIDKLR
jgi:N-acetyl sugar amidotransferase